MVATDGKRGKRVAEQIRAELMALLLRGEVKDPAASGAHVTTVSLTDDLQLARVRIRLVGPEPTEARKKQLMAAMKRARGFLRREVGTRLGLRRTPELEFHWDAGIDRALRVEAILEEIAGERQRGGGGET